MPNKKISELTAAAPTGVAEIPFSEGGVTKKATVAQIVAYASEATVNLGAGTLATLKRFSNNVGVGVGNSGTAATVTLEANSPWGVGVPAYKVVAPAGNSWHEVQAPTSNISAFDGHVIWKVWIEDYTATTQIQSYAGTSGYGRYWMHTHPIGSSSINRFNGEHSIVVGPVRCVGANTFVTGTDPLVDAKIRVFSGAGGSTFWVKEVVVPAIGRPTHVITHDDASVTWIDYAMSALAANGLRATFGVYTSTLGTSPTIFLTNAQVQAIAAAGHMIASHNVANTALADGTGGTQAAVDYAADFRAALNVLGGLVGVKADCRYHPWVQGRNNQDAHDRLVAHGLQIARGTDAGYDFPQVGLGQGVLSLKTMGTNSMTEAQMLATVTAARKYGLLTTWMVHEITPAGGVGVETSVARYQYLCGLIGAEVAAGRAAHRTMGELAAELYQAGLVTRVTA